MKHLILFLAILLAACGKKDMIAPSYPTDSIGSINRWILDSLKRYYYWSDEIPTNPVYTRSTDAFFGSLLSSQDRFSWISNGADLAPASNSYFTYGFHYALLQVSGYDGLVGVITAVNSGGPADRAGLQRGSWFLEVNGQKITAQNMDGINDQLNGGISVKLRSAVYSSNTWTPAAELTLSTGFAFENVVEHTRTFSAGGITTGYLYYSSFDESWDAQLLQAVGKLKQAGITELVLDLRYNAGGDVASSAKLACLIAGKLTADETYAIYAGNRFEGRRGHSLQAVLSTSGNATGRQYTDLQPLRLSLNRVFILTTRATTSAAELIINNLKPFLSVVQIGETTRGKDEAGFVIRDLRNPPQVAWSMEPTVYKLFNKNNEGNYSNGLVPQYLISELDQLPLAEIGSTGDPLLKKALEIIYGARSPGNFTELRVRPRPMSSIPLYRSAEATGNSTIMLLNGRD